jgi:hypothetical protein
MVLVGQLELVREMFAFSIAIQMGTLKTKYRDAYYAPKIPVLLFPFHNGLGTLMTVPAFLLVDFCLFLFGMVI